jgi:hypothetical protein
MSSAGVAIGLRVKTARATAVLVGDPAQPRALERRELVLYDPDVPHSGQPYHLELELAAAAAAPLLAKALAAVRRVGKRELAELVESLGRTGVPVRGVGLVAGSLGDPQKLANPHVRAHALEGRLYWSVLEDAARELGVACSVTTEKEIWARAAKSLGRRPETLRKVVAEWGRELGRPWGAEEKTAALAAWTMLSA